MNFKTFALTAILAVSGISANAATLGWAWNKDYSGKINLSDDSSKRCNAMSKNGDSWAYAELVANDGRIDAYGCWNRDEGTDTIRVRWGDGSEYTYSRNEFKDTPYFINRMLKEAEKKAGSKI